MPTHKLMNGESTRSIGGTAGPETTGPISHADSKRRRKRFQTEPSQTNAFQPRKVRIASKGKTLIALRAPLPGHQHEMGAETPTEGSESPRDQYSWGLRGDREQDEYEENLYEEKAQSARRDSLTPMSPDELHRAVLERSSKNMQLLEEAGGYPYNRFNYLGTEQQEQLKREILEAVKTSRQLSDQTDQQKHTIENEDLVKFYFSIDKLEEKVTAIKREQHTPVHPKALLMEEFEKLAPSQCISIKMLEYMAGSKEKQAYCQKILSEDLEQSREIPLARFFENDTDLKICIGKKFTDDGSSEYIFYKSDQNNTTETFRIHVEPDSNCITYYKESEQSTSEEFNAAFSKAMLLKGLEGRISEHEDHEDEEIKRNFQAVTDALKLEALNAHERLIEASTIIFGYSSLLTRINDDELVTLKENKVIASNLFQPLEGGIRVRSWNNRLEKWEVSGFFNSDNLPGMMRVEDSNVPHYLFRLRDGSYFSLYTKPDQNSGATTLGSYFLIYNPEEKLYQQYHSSDLDASLPPPHSNKTVREFLSENPMDTSYLMDFFKKASYASYGMGPGLIDRLICFDGTNESNLPKALDQPGEKLDFLRPGALEVRCWDLRKQLCQTPEGREKLHQNAQTIDLSRLEKHKALKEEAKVLFDFRSGKLFNTLADPKKSTTLTKLANASMLTALAAAITGLGAGIGALVGSGQPTNIDDLMDPSNNEVDEEELENKWEDVRFEGCPFLTSCEEGLEKPFVEAIDRINISEDLKKEFYQETDNWLGKFSNEGDRNAALEVFTEQIHQSIETTPEALNHYPGAFEEVITPQLEHFKADYLDQHLLNQTTASLKATPGEGAGASSSAAQEGAATIGAAAGAGVGVLTAGLIGGMKWKQHRKKKREEFNAAIEKAMKDPRFNRNPSLLKQLQTLKANPEALNELEDQMAQKINHHLSDEIAPMHAALHQLVLSSSARLAW